MSSSRPRSRSVIRGLRSACASAALVAAAAGSARAAIVVGFNSASDLNSFVVNHDGTAVPTTGANSNFNHSPTAGVNDNTGGTAGGGLLTTNFDANANYVGANKSTSLVGFDLTQSSSVSEFFKGSALGTDRIFQIGFINQANSSFNGDGQFGNSTAFISTRPYGTGQIEFQYKPSGAAGATSSTIRAAGTSLANNNWYRLTLTVQETAAGSNTFNYSVLLDDFGANGTVQGANLFNSGNLNQTGITGFDGSSAAANPTALAAPANQGFAGTRQVTDAPNLDNLVVTGTTTSIAVPEPTGLGAAAVAALGLLRRRRRNA